jgi:two-component system alkaline phosphatase synthesis response regulator PhoP
MDNKLLAHKERALIFQQFLNNYKLKFNEIEKKTKIASNKVAYHLNAMQKDLLLEKKNDYYQLTKNAEKQPFSLVEYTIDNQLINFETYEVYNLQHQVKETLSKKEIELLKLFIENENKVISRDEILDRLWGKEQFPTARTIDNYILMFRKLFEGDPKNPLYFHSIRGVGYKFTSNNV